MILISVGYAAAVSNNALPTAFGPLGLDGGERRLNVLISRAKHRMVVFSSITDLDIDADPRPEGTRPRGVLLLKQFLCYARTRGTDRPEQAPSALGRCIQQRLQAAGYTADGPLGTAECRVDLAVRCPTRPGQYCLGLLFDDAPGPEWLDAGPAFPVTLGPWPCACLHPQSPSCPSAVSLFMSTSHPYRPAPLRIPTCLCPCTDPLQGEWWP